MHNEIKMKLEASYDEELRDIDKYTELSRFAKDHGEIKVSKILKDIACEEKTHAKMIACMLGMEEEVN